MVAKYFHVFFFSSNHNNNEKKRSRIDISKGAQKVAEMRERAEWTTASSHGTHLPFA